MHDNKNPRYPYNPMSYTKIRSYRPDRQPVSHRVTHIIEIKGDNGKKEAFIETYPANTPESRAYFKLLKRMNPERYIKAIEITRVPLWRMALIAKRNKKPDYVHARERSHQTLTRYLPNV